MAEPQIRFDDGAAYERYMGDWSRPVGSVFLDWLAAASGLKWIDVGCGNGAFTDAEYAVRYRRDGSQRYRIAESACACALARGCNGAHHLLGTRKRSEGPCADLQSCRLEITDQGNPARRRAASFSHSRNPPRKAFALSPARQRGGSASSFLTLPPPITMSSGSSAAMKRATTSAT
jgi:hypothetical protein